MAIIIAIAILVVGALSAIAWCGCFLQKDYSLYAVAYSYMMAGFVLAFICAPFTSAEAVAEKNSANIGLGTALLFLVLGAILRGVANARIYNRANRSNRYLKK